MVLLSVQSGTGYNSVHRAGRSSCSCHWVLHSPGLVAAVLCSEKKIVYIDNTGLQKNSQE